MSLKYLYMGNIFIEKFKVNIFDINFILTFIGFTLFTTLLPSLSSVAIRGICLGVSVLCLFVSGIHVDLPNRQAKMYFVLLFIMIIRTTFDVMLGSLSNSPQSGQMLVMLFMYGVLLIPLISILSSINRMHWNTTFLILQVLLFIVVYLGIQNTNLDLYTTLNGRTGMNDRQGSLQFAATSSYLMIVSLVNFAKTPFRKKYISYVYRVFCILGVLLAFTGFSKAGSRGSFLASIVVIPFFIYNVSKHYKTWIAIFAVIISVSSVSILTFLDDFAPVLLERLTTTIEEGDMGRNELFNEGMELFKNSPILGDNPLLVWDGGFCGHHNMYLDVAIYVGIFGFLAFLNIIFYIVRYLMHNKSQDPVHLMFFMLSIVFIVRGFAGLTIVNDPLISLTFIISCLIINSNTSDKNKSRICNQEKN